ncbi:MAG: HEAT repeat domain-containing protein [Planctomycetota bacterium]|jgi:hypothetical protein
MIRLSTLLLLGVSACTNYSAGGRGGGGAPPAENDTPLDLSWLKDVDLPEHLDPPAETLEREIGEAVHRLHAADFATYSGAARRLVAIGEIAVPYLGFEAERRSKLGGDRQEVIVMRAILRKIPPGHLRHYLDSPFGAVRVAAAGVVGERDLAQHAVRLVDLLDDPDLEVRRAAIHTLRRLSNRFFGYRPDAPPEQRTKATGRWRELWGSG